MPKEKKFTRNKQQKIDLIVKVAHDLIREKGYEKLSTNHIADRAKIGIGPIYRNFPNGKADIMRFLISLDIPLANVFRSYFADSLKTILLRMRTINIKYEIYLKNH